MHLRPLHPLAFLVVLIGAACTGALVGVAVNDSPRPATASAQALAYFDNMARAHDSTGVEQAACVSAWTFSLQATELRMHIARVRPAKVHYAYSDSIRFQCFTNEGTVHTHSFVCSPSAKDREGTEMFGVVICPRPTRFAVFTVTPRAP